MIIERSRLNFFDENLQLMEMDRRRAISVVKNCVKKNIKFTNLENFRNRELRSGSLLESMLDVENSTVTDQNEIEKKLLERLIGCVDAHNAGRYSYEMLSNFGDLSNLLNYEFHQRAATPPIDEFDEQLRALLSSVKAIVTYFLKMKSHSDLEQDSAISLRRYLFATMAHLEVEEVRVLLLDNRLQVARDVVIARGTNASVHFPARELFRHALAENSAAFILVHNHPSGSSKPSEGDIQFTHHLVRTAKMLEIEFIDHLIIARDGCTSLRDAGIMPPI